MRALGECLEALSRAAARNYMDEVLDGGRRVQGRKLLVVYASCNVGRGAGLLCERRDGGLIR